MFRSSRWPEGIGITSSSERPRMQASRPTATESIRRLLQDSVACCAVWPATIAIPPRSRRFASSLAEREDRKSTRLNSSHDQISYAVFCLKKKKKKKEKTKNVK